MDQVEDVLHRLGSAFVSGLRRPGYRLITATEQGFQAQTHTMAGEPALLGRWDSMELNEAEAALRTVAGRGLVIEVIGDPDGNYTVHWARDVPSLPARIVLDEDYRFPGHEEAATRRPGAADRRPTDPAILAEVRQLVADFVARHHPAGYESGYGEEEILAAEERLGVRLPEDLRALYRVIRDDRQESGLMDPFVLAPLDVLLRWNRANAPGWQDGLFDDPVIFDCHPAGHVRRVSTSGARLTFARDYGMNFGAVDLDPGPLGVSGQVLRYGRDVWAPAGYVAPSIRDLIRRAIDSLDEAHPEPPSHETRVVEVEDPAVVQAVRLGGIGEARFADLGRFRNLRSITILGVRQKVDMSIPEGLPVERVDVNASRFDPADLVATPTVSCLTLAGNDAPVSIAALAALPNLLRLDLSGAAVTDVEALASFPALRVLILNGRQWTSLLATGWRPARLAAVALGGAAGVGDAARWSRAFGSPAGYHTLGGRRR
ncbi:SMI1/KNR4 family protein [Actinoplanes sp. NPDC026623]|uniref:SMI1/KNR4 family protein n=1 Tax=Actinoplanes sp. NPDC026623 TaxID=3155610 RepID=UPI0033D718B0